MTLEDRLAELTALQADATAPEAVIKLRHALGMKTGFVVAKAAEIAGEAELSQLNDVLVEAFERFMVNAAKSDPGCRAKAAAVGALQRNGHECESVYLRAARHVQMEAVWGGRVDTATDLRAAGAFGLVRIGSRHAMTVLADLLADPEGPVRAEAAKALAHRGGDDAAPLLRLRIGVGEPSAEALTEHFSALLRLTPDTALRFVAAHLDDPDAEHADAAAVALGRSRLAKAFELLRDWFERTLDQDRRRTALLTIAMLRRDGVTDWLVTQVAEADPQTAEQAIDALAIYRHDAALRGRVIEAARRRGLETSALRAFTD